MTVRTDAREAGCAELLTTGGVHEVIEDAIMRAANSPLQ
jgi:hypothetical protein